MSADVVTTRPSAAQRRASLVDIEQVAERLGVSVRHVRRLVAEKRIPYVKWGHLLRFDLEAIDGWIDGYVVPSSSAEQAAMRHPSRGR
jgi:excisionase family DNA binding protein